MIPLYSIPDLNGLEIYACQHWRPQIWIIHHTKIQFITPKQPAADATTRDASQQIGKQQKTSTDDVTGSENTCILLDYKKNISP